MTTRFLTTSNQAEPRQKEKKRKESGNLPETFGNPFVNITISRQRCDAPEIGFGRVIPLGGLLKTVVVQNCCLTAKTSIIDTGIGILAEDRAKIFQNFARWEATMHTRFRYRNF
jgi:hypothetical protein